MLATIFLLIFSAALFGYGIFVMLFRAGRRLRGVWTAIAAVFILFFGVILMVESDAKNEGWATSASKLEAAKQGITDPATWQKMEAAKATAEAEATKQAAEEARIKGFHCLFAFDGSHTEANRLIKAMMREPDSFEHIETKITPIDDDGNHTIFVTYRARNGFGGMNVGTAIATVKSSDCTATILSVE